MMHRSKVKAGIKVIGFLIIFFATVPHAAAQTGSGQELFEDCKSLMRFNSHGAADLLSKPFKTSEVAAAHTCLAFLDAVVRTTVLHEVMGAQPLFCTPKEGLRRGDAAKIYVEWATANTDKLKDLRIINAVQAFRDAFPCK